MMTRLSFLLLVLAVSLGLSACGGSGTGSVTSNQNNTTVQQPEQPKEPTQLERENAMGESFSAFTKKLQDGRVVQCVGQRVYSTAMAVTCDFANAK